jgi:hypothetical protein
MRKEKKTSITFRGTDLKEIELDEEKEQVLKISPKSNIYGADCGCVGGSCGGQCHGGGITIRSKNK